MVLTTLRRRQCWAAEAEAEAVGMVVVDAGVADVVVAEEEDSFEEDEVGAVVVEEKGEVSMIEAVARKEAKIGSVEAVVI